jgi:RecA/RadA recombinase
VKIKLDRVHPPVTGRVGEAIVRDYTCTTGAWKLKQGAKVTSALPGPNGKSVTVTLHHFNAAKGTFSVRSRAALPPGPFVAELFFDKPTVWESLMRVGKAALEETPDRKALTALALLDRRPPLPADAMAPVSHEEVGDRAVRLTGEMTAGVLPVQGPPGTGKTTTAAEIVLAEVARAGAAGSLARVGVVANSHKVIDNLLAEVAKLARKRGVDLAVGHVGTPAQVAGAGVDRIDGSEKLVSWLADMTAGGRPAIAGATKFGWSREDAAGAVGLLIVDEAGQLSLADALAVAQASARIVALGDPQQLASPVQAAHSEAVRVSLLEHLAEGESVLAPHVGVFLDVSHRMHPEVSRVVGELAYDGRLASSEGAAARHIEVKDGHVRAGGFVVPVTPGVVWLRVEGDEGKQADVVAELVAALCAGDVKVTDGGDPEDLTAEEVLVVAPHNAHVNRINGRLEGSCEVGTVDRFQGKQAHVVVFAQGRPAGESRDVPFLYEINRLNVALSRARLMAVVIAHPDAVFAPVSDPEHLRLVSRFATAVAGRAALRT